MHWLVLACTGLHWLNRPERARANSRHFTPRRRCDVLYIDLPEDMPSMARPEVTARRVRAADKTTPTGPPDLDAYSVDEFCRRHSISVPMFYKMRKEMPATFKVGARTLISKESAAAWRAACEEKATKDC
jgi:hypothetical protein